MRRRTERPKLGSRYQRLLAATTISNLGDGVSTIAYPWLASAITRNPLLVALVAVAQRIVGRARHHQIEARAGQLLLGRRRQQVALDDRAALGQAVMRRVAQAQGGQPRLQLDEGHLGRRIVLGQGEPDHAHPRAQIDKPPERRRPDEIGEQQRIDAEPVADARLEQGQSPAQDRITSQLIILRAAPRQPVVRHVAGDERGGAPALGRTRHLGRPLRHRLGRVEGI